MRRLAHISDTGCADSTRFARGRRVAVEDRRWDGGAMTRLLGLLGGLSLTMDMGTGAPL
jgi:hypothetical protein